jgi:excinuclease ABC subunit A
LVARGDTVVIVEHHLDLIRNSDWVIDLGPAGGDAGGYLVAEGPVETIMACEESWTGRFLRDADTLTPGVGAPAVA